MATDIVLGGVLACIVLIVFVGFACICFKKGRKRYVSSPVSTEETLSSKLASKRMLLAALTIEVQHLEQQLADAVAAAPVVEAQELVALTTTNVSLTGLQRLEKEALHNLQGSCSCVSLGASSIHGVGVFALIFLPRGSRPPLHGQLPPLESRWEGRELV